jgi:hypothetical protein
MLKKVLLGLSVLMISGGMALAADTAKPKGADLHPDLRKILEEQAQKESAGWKASNEYYAKTCLKDLEPGKPVPPASAVSTTECYIGAIDKNVKPMALNTTMVDDMTGEWKTLARKYGAGQMTHQQWVNGMHDTQKKFAAARIQIIEGLVADAAKQQLQTPTAKTAPEKPKSEE